MKRSDVLGATLPAERDETVRSYELHHVGQLLRRIRQSRGWKQTEVAELTGVSVSTIGRIERDKGHYRDENFAQYVEFLQRLPSPDNITNEEADILKELYEHSRQREERETELRKLNFQISRSPRRPEALTELVAKLSEPERGPAHIMDPLWFTHAVNGALFRLFGLNQASAYLNQWAAWHSLATKVRDNSPVRRAHVNRDNYFSPLVEEHFADKVPRRYMFTTQMRALHRRLARLSGDDDAFGRAWARAVRLQSPYTLASFTRTVWFGGEWITVEIEPTARVEVELEPGYPVEFQIIEWKRGDSASKEIIQRIKHEPLSHKVFFAADYDLEERFHVNNWPEVQAAWNRASEKGKGA